MSYIPQASATRLIPIDPARVDQASARARSAALINRIKVLGAAWYDMILPETHILPYVIHPDETLLGIVFGRYKQDNGTIVGRGALVATDRRAMLIDKKPLFVRSDEVVYRAVSGVTYGRVGIIGNVTLHTKIGDIKLRTFNQKCAQSFVEAVESQIFKTMEV